MILAVSLLLLLSVAPCHGQVRATDNHCASFRSHYEVYCRGIWTPEKLLRLAHHLERIEKFCPNYKRVCLKIADNEEHKHMSKAARRRLEHSIKYELSYDDIMQRLADAIPCTPDCKHPHCTPECKCDYDWPMFQKHCYPLSLKEFEATCSVWFDRCTSYAKKAEEQGPSEERDVVTHPPLDTWRRMVYNRG